MPRRTSLIAAALLAGAALLVPVSGAFAAKTAKVTVMTRNLFLGADLIPLAAASPGAEFEKSAGAMLAGVEAAQPKARMKLVAGEIAKAKPDLVGLQEVSIWRTGPKGSPPARHVVVDYLKVIRRELARRNQPYKVVTRKQAFNVEGPTDRGVDVRLTLGDVILARKGVKVRHPRSGVFADQLHINVAELGGDVSTNRSWNAFDATVHGAHVRFVNAHLEAYNNDFKLAQAKALVAGPLKHKGLTILAGDLNSGPTLPAAADRPPYEAIAAAGFKPYRTKKNSCCFEDIATGSGAWDHNVDWIMARPKVKLLRSYVTGRERTKRGVYPSDHGGVVSVLRVKR